MRIAILTHAFPPSSHPNAKRPYYIAKGLLDAGWEVDVYSSWLACRTRGETLTHERLRVTRVRDPVEETRNRMKRFRALYRVLTLAANGLLWPDQYAKWVRRLIARELQQAASTYDRVLAFVFPPSMYLTGAAGGLVDRSWTFDLQESVTPQFKRLARRSPLQRFRLPKLEELEASTLKKAGAVVFTANTNRQKYVKDDLVDSRTTRHIPYFYDTSVFTGKGPEVRKDFAICYFGAFDWRGSRSPAVFFEAFGRFVRRIPESRGEAKFVFYGAWINEHDQLVEQHGIRDFVEINEPVPYASYIDRVRESPALLLVVAPQHDLFMPSKIVDYFGAKRPILALVPEKSEMDQVLRSAKMERFLAKNDDVEGCPMYLKI